MSFYNSIGMEPVYNHFGAKVALSNYGVPPTSEDIIGELESATGFGYKTDNIDTTSVSSTTGFTRTTPLKKTPNEGTVTVFKNNTDYVKVYNKYFGYNTSEDGYYCRLTITWPKGVDWTGIKDVSLDGYISGFDWADINTSTAQTFSFTFQPIGAPSEFDGFVNITALSAGTTVLTANGGTSLITLTGTNLIDNLLVKAFVGTTAIPSTIGYTSGSDTSQTVTITFPENSTTSDVVYTVKASKDGGITYSEYTVTVTVSAASE